MPESDPSYILRGRAEGANYSKPHFCYPPQLLSDRGGVTTPWLAGGQTSCSHALQAAVAQALSIPPVLTLHRRWFGSAAGRLAPKSLPTERGNGPHFPIVAVMVGP